MPYLCLIIEAERVAATALQREFPAFGFKPCTVASCEAALGLLRQWRFDAVLLDAEGFGDAYVQVLRKLHRQARGPLVLLTPAQDEPGQLLGLESGATEVVAKPASSRLITAKLRRLIEIAGHTDDDALSEFCLGPLRLDLRRGAASIAGASLDLTAQQFELLWLLATRAGDLVPRETMARALRSSACGIGRSSDMHVCRIRKKLIEHGGASLRLETVYGRGYRLCAPGDAASPDGEPAHIAGSD
jgi:DNA-binding response OmpR family regulator